MPPVNRRKDTNFFEKFDVSSTSFDVLASWNFISVGLAVMVESNDSSDIVQYSFDGETVHGDMRPTFPSEAIIFDNRAQSKIWFRRATPGVAVIVRVEAWRYEA